MEGWPATALLLTMGRLKRRWTSGDVSDTNSSLPITREHAASRLLDADAPLGAASSKSDAKDGKSDSRGLPSTAFNDTAGSTLGFRSALSSCRRNDRFIASCETAN